MHAWKTFVRTTLKYFVAPPLWFCGKVLSLVCGPALAVLDRYFAHRERERLERDIRGALPFLFDEYQGTIVPTPNVPFPPGFDYAFVTVETGSLRIRFSRGRNELDVGIGSKDRQEDIYSLLLVLSLLDGIEEPNRGTVVDLQQVSSLLEATLPRLEDSLGGDTDLRLLERLKEVEANDRIAIRQAEWEIKKHLG